MESEKKESSSVAVAEENKKKTESDEEEESSYEYVTDSEAGEEEEEEEEEEIIEEEVTVTEVVKDAEQKKAPVTAVVANKAAQSSGKTTTTSSTTSQKGTETKSVSSKLTTKTTTTVQTSSSSSASKKSSSTEVSGKSSSSTASNSNNSTTASSSLEEKKKDTKPVPAPVATTSKKDSSEAETSSASKLQSADSGESLLLPLLQGLLHKNSSQRSLNDQSMSDTMVPHRMEDSGTESGEDLRLLAAGLQNAMHRNSQSNDPKVNKDGMGLLEEVTAALERLESSLKAGADMNMHKGKKQNLLLLVSRLKNGLISPDKLEDSPEIEAEEPNFEEVKAERRMSGHGRFAKRRNRNNRHTVGVSREELADARQLMEDMMIRKSIPNMETANVTTKAQQPPCENYALQKQLSLGAVLYRPHQFVPEEIKKNTQALVKNTPQFPTPVTYYQEKKPKFKFIRQAMSVDQGPEVTVMSNNRIGAVSHCEATTVSSSGKGILKVNGNAAAAPPRGIVTHPDSEEESSEEEFEPGQTNGFDYDGEEYSAYRQPVNTKPGFLSKGKPDRRKIVNRCRTPPGKLFEAPSVVVAPVQVRSMMMTSDEDGTRKKPQSKFSKKLRMKRANTIDIPKPFGFHPGSTADDSDEDDEEVSMTQSLHHSHHRTDQSVGLKKAIDVGDKVKAKRVVPKFKPQTENDHKFLAFIQRQAPPQGTSWVNPNAASPKMTHPSMSRTNGGHNWNNKFGNIKNAFEKPPGPVSHWGGASSANANKTARNFWHKSESESSSRHPSQVENSKFPIPPFAQHQQTNGHHPSHHPNNHHVHNNHNHHQLSSSQQPHHNPHNRSPHHQSRSKAASAAWKQRTMSQPEIMHYEPQHTITGGLKIRDVSAEYVPPTEVEYYNQPPLVQQQSFVPMSYQQPQETQQQQMIVQDPPQAIYQPQPLVMPKPVPVNQFSHNPMSAFKPIPKKIQAIPAFKPIEPPVVINNVKKRKDSYNELDAKAAGQSQPFTSPTRNIVNNPFNQKFNGMGNSPVNKSPTLPWTSKPVFENRVLNLATTKFDQAGPAGKVSPRTQTMKYKSPTNHMISSFGGHSQPPPPPVHGYSPVRAPGSSKMYEKRPSLPNTAYPFYYEDDLETMKNTRLNENLFTDNPSYVPRSMPKSDPPSPRLLSRAPHSHSLHDLRQPEMQMYHAPPANNYVVTDYTPQSCVSTCVPTWHLTPTDNVEPMQLRDELESITNPNGQPLVLTCNQPVYSPSQLTQHNGNGHQETLKIFDYPSPIGGSSNNETNDEWDDEPELTDSTEYKAVSSRVMTGPVQQTAVTVANKVKKRFDDEERDSKAAKSLHSVLKGIKKVDKPDPFKSNEIMGKSEVVSRVPVQSASKSQSKSPNVSGVPPRNDNNMCSQYPVASVTNESVVVVPQKKAAPVVQSQNIETRAPQKITNPPPVVSVQLPAPTQNNVIMNNTSNSSRSPLPPKSPLNNNSLAQYRVPEIPFRPQPQIVETPATPQTQGSHIVFNNVSRGLPPRDPQIRQSYAGGELSESRNPAHMRTNENGEIRGFNVGGSALSKSDSWHQICQLQQGKPPSPVPNRSVQRAKSGHNLLALPKQYEGGIDREKLQEKQKTVSAYFGASASSSTSTTTMSTSSTATTTAQKKTTINRIKTSEKASVGNQKPSSGLCRSNTMPSMATATTKLDEQNIDDAFEDLFNTAMQ